MPVPLLRRAIRRRHSAVDEERGGRVVARHIFCTLEKHLFDETTPRVDVANSFYITAA